ncbi:MAG: hypothetical protein AMJ65_18795 [Phycisphaerae bacterium SG8_4]|nr:MAG: hypothetical protein AMJ65_18795 [Phycisphaerae bacterium SG8_4]
MYRQYIRLFFIRHPSTALAGFDPGVNGFRPGQVAKLRDAFPNPVEVRRMTRTVNGVNVKANNVGVTYILRV